MAIRQPAMLGACVCALDKVDEMSVLDQALAALDLEPQGRVRWTVAQAIQRSKARIALRVAKSKRPNIVRLRLVGGDAPCDGCSRVGFHTTWCPIVAPGGADAA